VGGTAQARCDIGEQCACTLKCLDSASTASTVRSLICAILAAGATLAWGQSLPLEPTHDAGAGITGAFEGWFKNSDGTFSFLVGYYNRNHSQEADIPIGPNNQIEPGGPDRGQPTHFHPGRAWGIFTIKVSADFGQNKLVWTLDANGKPTAIPLSLHPDYEISPFVEASVGNTPPVVSFEEHGPSVQGPREFAVERKAKVGEPLALTVWVSDDAKYVSNTGGKPKPGTPPVTLKWSMYRGPALVAFAPDQPKVEKLEPAEGAPFHGKATTAATFSEPGQYVLSVMANDYSGEGGRGFQCCWTNAQVKVLVER
jgi:hypothetical protein